MSPLASGAVSTEVPLTFSGTLFPGTAGVSPANSRGRRLRSTQASRLPTHEGVCCGSTQASRLPTHEGVCCDPRRRDACQLTRASAADPRRRDACGPREEHALWKNGFRLETASLPGRYILLTYVTRGRICYRVVYLCVFVP